MTNASLYLCIVSPEHPGRQKGRAKHIITMFGTKDRLTTLHYQSQGEIVYLLLLDRREKWDQTGCCSVLIKVGPEVAFYQLNATRGEIMLFELLAIYTRICIRARESEAAA